MTLFSWFLDAKKAVSTKGKSSSTEDENKLSEKNNMWPTAKVRKAPIVNQSQFVVSKSEITQQAKRQSMTNESPQSDIKG